MHSVLMNRLFTNFLAALFVVHATLGCCLHHVHACELASCETSASAVSECGCHGCAEDGDATLTAARIVEDVSLVHGAQLAHHFPHECDREECNVAFVGSSPATALLKTDAMPAVFAAFAADATLAAAPRAGADLNFVGLGLRPHLFLSILLI